MCRNWDNLFNNITADALDPSVARSLAARASIHQEDAVLSV